MGLSRASKVLLKADQPPKKKRRKKAKLLYKIKK